MRRLLVLVSMFWLSACGDDPRTATDRHARIVDGELTNGFENVVAISLRRTQCDDPPVVLCSGTLVAPRAVLSAAHCFVPMRPGLAYEVFAGDGRGLGEEGVTVSSVVPHPGFDELSRKNDLSVLWLERPIDGVAPEALPTGETPIPEAGERVDLVGFGATTPGVVPDGAKRIGVGRIGSADDGVVSVDPDPSVSCVGDSGGPLFTTGDTRALVGVASSGDPGCREDSIYALIAPALESFVEPTLEAGPPSEPVVADPCGPPIPGPDVGDGGAGCAVSKGTSGGGPQWLFCLALTAVGIRITRASWG